MKKRIFLYVLIIVLFVLSSCLSSTSDQTPEITEIPSTATAVEIETTAQATSTLTSTPTPTLPPTSTQPPSPMARGYAQIIALSEEEILIYGGWKYEKPDEIKNDAWVFNISEGWRKLTSPSTENWWASSPKPPFWGPLAIDLENNQAVLYIGSIQQKSGIFNNSNKLWSFDITNEVWTELSSESTPTGLLGAVMAYDSESDRMVLFGGLDVPSWEFSDQTWSYDLNTNTWDRMNPSVQPEARNYSAAAYSSSQDRVLLFGGGGSPNPTIMNLFSGTWIYNLNSDTWREVLPENSPTPRIYSAMAYDPQSDKFYLFGGMDSAGTALSDFWSFDLKHELWEEITPLESPSKRGHHCMTTLKEGQIVMFGGGSAAFTFTNEIWLYDVELNTWTQLYP